MSQSNTNIVQARFLADIIVLQQTTAPVALEIGAVINGTVENGVITVSKAPGAILSRVISIADSLGVLYSLSITITRNCGTSWQSSTATAR